MKTAKAVFGIIAISLGLVRRVCGPWILPLLLVLTVPAVVQAQFSYSVNGGTITITGYTGPGGAVNIPSEINNLPVTSIADDAFWGCTGLTAVTIPSTVTSIGDGVFDFCASLTAITVDALNPFYSSVDGVLCDKSSTTLIEYPGGRGGSYTVPAGIINVGDFAFAYCSSLTTVAIPKTVTTIGDGAFLYCSSLSTLTVDPLNPAYSSSVDGVLFNKSQTTLVQYPGGKAGGYAIPNGVTSIDDDALDGCFHLTWIAIPSTVTTIGGSAFAGTGLATVTIPDSVTAIGGAAFYDCTNLAAVTIPGSVSNIGDYAFGGCTGLTKVYFQSNAPSPNNDLTVFSGDSNATVYYLAGSTGWGSTFDGLPAMPWPPPPPLVPISLNVQNVYASGIGEILIMTWTNSSFSLQAAPSATGAYTDIPDAVSPFVVTASGRQRFFRLQAN